MRYRTWMQDSKEIHDTLLANICLPATHDSGTYRLQKELAPEKVKAGIAAILNQIAAIAKDIPADIENFIPGFNATTWLVDHLHSAIVNLTRCTTRTIKQQLEDGIRCLDLRVYYNVSSKKFYVHHGLVGPRLDGDSGILHDIASFLESTSPGGGEIVYITLGHELTSEDDNANFAYKDLAKALKDQLGPYLYVPTYDSDRDKEHGEANNDPFEQTYAQIVNTGGTAQSRVVVACAWLKPGEGHKDKKKKDYDEWIEYFWPRGYSPPDKGGDVIRGEYEETTKLDEMLHEQKKEMRGALEANAPFALYMTLTPSDDDYKKAIAGAAVAPLGGLMAQLLAIPGAVVVAAAIGALANALLIYASTSDVTKLSELAGKVNAHLERTILRQFVPESGINPNRISMIYCDFYENTRVVDLAIRLSGARVSDWVGDHEIVFTGQPPQALADASPALAISGHQALAVYAYDGNLYQAVSSYFEDYSVWSGGTLIATPAGQLQSGRWQPALAEHEGRVWLAYVDQKSRINLACCDAGTWVSNTVVIQTTGAGPALASYRGSLYLFYQGEDDMLECATSADGVTWQDGPITVGSGTAYTSATPTAAVHEDKLYVLYLGTSKTSNTVYWAAFDGETWSGNEQVKVHDGDTLKTKGSAPGAASVDGTLWLLYRGEHHHDLYETTLHRGKWSGNHKLSNRSSISPESSANPAVVAYEGGLCALYRSSSGSDKMFSAAYLPNPCAWTEPAPFDFEGTKPHSTSAAVAPSLAPTGPASSANPGQPTLWATYVNGGTMYYAHAPASVGQLSWTAGAYGFQGSTQPVAMAACSGESLLAWVPSTTGTPLQWGFASVGYSDSRGPIEINPSRTTLPSDVAPALALYDGRVYMAYWATGGDGQLSLAAYDPERDAWEGLGSITLPGSVAPQTNIRPSLATHGAELFVSWIDSDQKVYVAGYDGSSWKGCLPLPAGTENPITPGSSDAPTMMSFRGRLLLFYKGATKNDLYFCWLRDSVWGGDLRLSSVMAAGAPASPYGPAVTACDDALYLVYEDPSGKNLDYSIYGRTISVGEAR